MFDESKLVQIKTCNACAQLLCKKLLNTTINFIKNYSVQQN